MNKERIARVCALMQKEGLKQLLVSATASIYYLTGLWVDPHERMLALLLRVDGTASLFGNSMFGLPEKFSCPIVLHKDGEEPTAQLAAAIGAGKLGIDKFWPSKFLLALMEQRPDMKPVLGSAPLDEARKCKDEQECAAMRESSRINDSVMAEAIDSLHEGVRENQIAAIVNHGFLERGADCEGVQLICFGPNGADPHHGADSTLLKAGDSVILDIFTPIRHHWCDMTRTVFYQEASARQRAVYELVRRANEAAIAAVRPGVLPSQLDGIARDIITDGGYGAYFTHRLGHGCGMDCHEPPDISAASHGPLEVGMIFSIEPGVYLPGEFGVRIEDLVLVTENGCEVLNSYPKDLRIIAQ